MVRQTQGDQPRAVRDGLRDDQHRHVDGAATQVTDDVDGALGIAQVEHQKVRGRGPFDPPRRLRGVDGDHVEVIAGQRSGDCRITGNDEDVAQCSSNLKKLYPKIR